MPRGSALLCLCLGVAASILASAGSVLADHHGPLFEPAAGRPGTRVILFHGCGYYQDNDWVIFSDRDEPLSAEGVADPGRGLASVPLNPVDGVVTEYGTYADEGAFDVPRLPVGAYYLYVFCNDASACCAKLGSTFRILGAPDTASEEIPLRPLKIPWDKLLVVFGLGLAAATMYLKIRRSSVP